MTIPFTLGPGVQNVRLMIHDVAGRRVRRLDPGAPTVGPREVRWDGRDDDGRPVANGVYFVSLRLDGELLRQNLVVVN